MTQFTIQPDLQHMFSDDHVSNNADINLLAGFFTYTNYLHLVEYREIKLDMTYEQTIQHINELKCIINELRSAILNQL